MEDEGIMALPQGQPQQPNALPELPSADTYDAVLTGLRNNDPEQAAAVKAAAREAVADLDLSPQELDAVLNVLEYMARNPAEYTKLRQNLIDQDLMDPEDLPEQFDAEYLGTAIMVLNEAKMLRAENAQAVTEMAPQVEGLGPMPMAEGGLADVGRYLASYGRNGDTMLAHITPAEAAMLMRRGASGTVNPQTGLPEFFLKKLFKSIKKAVKSVLKNPIVRVVATVALASFMGPAAASVVGSLGATGATAAAAATALASTAATAAVTAAAGEKIDPKSLLINAATSYFGAGGTLGGYNPIKSIAGSDFLKNFGVTPGSSTATGIATGITNAAIGKAAGMGTQQALLMGIQSGVMAGMQQSRSVADLAKQTPDQLKNMGYSDPQIANIQKGIAPGTPANAPQQAGAQPPASTPAPGGGTAAEAVATGAPGPIGTATELPSLAAVRPPEGMQYDVLTNKFVPMGTVGAAPSTAATASTYPTGLSLGQRVGEIFKPSPGNTSTLTDRLSNVFLVNPNATTDIGRYIPAGLTLAGIGALSGGYKQQPVDMSPAFDQNITGTQYIRANPAMFASNLGRIEGPMPAYNPMVPYSEYSQLLAPPIPQPVYMANGGDVAAQANKSFKRQDFRENPYVQGFNFADPQQIAALNAQQEKFSSVLSLMNMNPGMSFNKALAYMGGDLGPMYDRSANFDWGGDLPYDPTIYGGRDLDWQQYLTANPDLRAAGIDTPWEAATHYANYGKNENRAGVSFRNPYYNNPEGLARALQLEDEEQQRLAQMGGGIVSAMPQSTPSVPAQTARAAPSTQPSAMTVPAAARSVGISAFFQPPSATSTAMSMAPSYGIPYTLPSLALPPMSAPVSSANNRSSMEMRQPIAATMPYSEYSQLLAPPIPQPVYGMKRGGDPSKFPRKTGPINGPGTGTSDSIPAMLSDGEFVFTAKAVRNAGGGSRRKGAKRMYALMKKLEGGPVTKGNA